MHRIKKATLLKIVLTYTKQYKKQYIQLLQREGCEGIESALIVSATDKGTVFLSDILKEFSIEKVVPTSTGQQARRMITEQDFDLVIINAPLKDESGEKLSRHIISKEISQVILIVKSDYYDEVSSLVEDDGVITLAKPINKSMLWFSLKLAKVAHNRMRKMQRENSKLVEKIADIKIVSRAKSLLISYLNMTEDEAHKHIEREAMDGRVTRRSVAEGILRMYENK